MKNYIEYQNALNRVKILANIRLVFSSDDECEIKVGERFEKDIETLQELIDNFKEGTTPLPFSDDEICIDPKYEFDKNFEKLIKVGFRGNLKGTRYLAFIIAIFGNSLKEISLERLYDEIIKAFNATRCQVERNINYAISSCYKNVYSSILEKYDLYLLSNPTPAYFIKTILVFINNNF